MLRKAVRNDMKEKLGVTGGFDESVSTISDMFKAESVNSGMYSQHTIDFDWGHPNSYYTGKSELLEFFAESMSAKIMNDGDLKSIKKILPKAYSEYEKIIGGLS